MQGRAKADLTVRQKTKAINTLATKYGWAERDGSKAVFVAKKCLKQILEDAVIQEIRTRPTAAIQAVQTEENADLGAIVPIEET